MASGPKPRRVTFHLAVANGNDPGGGRIVWDLVDVTSTALQPVLVFSKYNKLFVGYFDPNKLFFLYYENK